MHHPNLTVSLPPKKIHQQPEGVPRDRKPCLPRPRNLPDSVPYKSGHLWQRVHMGFMHCGRGCCWWPLSICALLFLNKRASNSELSSLLLWLKSLYPTSHAAGCVMWVLAMGYKQKWYVPILGSVLEGKQHAFFCSSSYSFLGFRHDGWAQATIFRQWGVNSAQGHCAAALSDLASLLLGFM